ncbi:unnamed protein product, partial [Mesorhabditis belari]|uniref:Glutathione S-transferase kappa n=1 Tax=Mesorhabditis belari TaxID=2138241 RepID=A0AAF3EW33_9BILA
MSARKVRVDLFYDIISPYAWINFEAWLRYSKKWPVDLHLRPFYLPGIFQKTGNIPPISIPEKNDYLNKDLQRLNEYWGTELVWHKDFRAQTLARSSIYAQRFLAAVQLYEPDKLIPASRAFWKRGWVEKESVYEEGDVRKISHDLKLKCEKRILGSLKSDEVKNLIIDNTNEALATKAFGTPWQVLTMEDGKKEAFFGCDRMHLVAQTLKQPYYGPLKELAKEI